MNKTYVIYTYSIMKHLLTSCPIEIQCMIWKTYMSKHVLKELQYCALEHYYHDTFSPFLINDYDPIIDYVLKTRTIYLRKLINYDVPNMFILNYIVHNNQYDSPIIRLLHQFKHNTNPNKNQVDMINVEREYRETKHNIMRLEYLD